MPSNFISTLSKATTIKNKSKNSCYSINSVSKAVLSALAILPFTLNAAEVGAVSPQANDKQQSDLEIVTVTAQKRVQNILKVPVTVGTVSADTLEESSSVLLSDVDKFIPGFDFSDSSMTQAGITMRGISSPNISVGGDPSSATFFDDIYMPRAAQNVLFSDMARIEVLKGPQGTLFGRNAAMGVVNMVPNSPNADFEGFLKATLGSDNLKRYEGMINTPLTDTLYMRANFLANAQDGIVKNIAKPSWNANSKIWDLGERSHNAARLSLLWDISSATNFQLSYDWDDLEQAPPMAIGTSVYAYNQGKTPFADKAENDVKDGVESRDMYGVTAKLNHEFNEQWSMKYVASYRDWQTVNREDEDGTSDITRYFDTSNNEDSNIFYTELQFNYVSDKINAVTGFSYSKEDVKQTTELNITADSAARLITGGLNEQFYGQVAQQVAGMLGGNSDALASAAFGDGVTFNGAVDAFYGASGFPVDHLWNAGEWANAINAAGAADMFMNVIGMPGVPLTADIINMTGDASYDFMSAALGSAEIFGPSHSGQFWQETVNNTGNFTNWGIYGDIDYAVNEKWHVIGGLRYSKDKKDFSWYIPHTSFADIRPGVANLLFPVVDMDASDTWSKVTGRLVTSYQLTDKQMVFGSYSTGYKSGGFDSLVPNTQSFSPEDTTNYEVGYKAVLFKELVVNLSAYYLELNNLQRTVDSKTPESSQAIPTIINEDRKITGTEIDLRWLVSDSLTLGVVSEIRSTENSTPEFYNGNGELISAQTKTYDASTNYTITADWTPNFNVGTTNLHLDYVYVENQNDQQIGLEDYKKAVSAYFRDTKSLNARLSWANDDDTIEIGLWGKNLFDERYVLGLGGLTANVLATPHASINRGREAGVDFKYSF